MISVIVPIYNVEKYVARCIEAICSQTYRDLEIILVDDGTRDNSGKICDEYSEKDNRIKVIHKENGGLSDARNAGIDIAKGDFLFFVDSDDLLAPNMIEVLYDDIIKYDADIAMSSFWWQEEKDKLQKPSSGHISVYYKPEINSLLLKNDFNDNCEIVVAWNKLYRKHLFNKNRYPVGRLHEDEYLIHHILYECSCIVYNSQRLYYYMQHSNGITGAISVKRMEDVLYAFDDRMDFWTCKGEEKLLFELQEEVIGLYKFWCSKYKENKEIVKLLKNKMRYVSKKMYKKGTISLGKYIGYYIWLDIPKMAEWLIQKM